MMSIIAPDCRITGKIRSSGEIFIDGEVDDVICATAVIGEKGSVRHIIDAKVVRVHGSVTGKIVAAAVEIAETARVAADIDCDRLAVAAGAKVEGYCRHPTRESASSVPSPQRSAGQG